MSQITRAEAALIAAAALMNGARRIVLKAVRA
jgi:hypothetical protein